MIDDLKPYPEYKNSGLPWLGQVPAHWRVLRAKTMFQEVDERSTTGREELLSVSHITGVTPRSQKNVTMFLAKSNVGHKICRPNDVVINTMWAWMGALGVSRHTGLVSPAYGVYRPHGSNVIEPRFADYLLRTPAYAAEYQRRSTGVNSSRLRLYPEHFLRVPVVVPPPDEQAAIVRFLGWATGQVDRAILAKRKVIALLNEQRQAITTKTLINGLTRSVPQSDTGVSWIGRIPKGWEVHKLGRHIELATGFAFPSSDFSHDSDDIRLLRGINVTPKGVRWDTVVHWPRRLEDGLDWFTLTVGDIVLGMDRPIIAAGVRAAVIRQEDTPSLLLQRVARLRPKSSLDSQFLLLVLQGRMFAEYMAPIFTGISVPHLSPDQIRGFKLPIPPLEEQLNIVKVVEKETAALSSAMAIFEKEVDLLIEYRGRIIQDAITGRMKLTEAAQWLPEVDATSAADDFDGQSTLEEIAEDEAA